MPIIFLTEHNTKSYGTQIENNEVVLKYKSLKMVLIKKIIYYV